MKGSARGPWLAAGGAKEEFEQDWPEIRRQMLRDRALEGGSAARREQREHNIRAF